MPSLPFKYMKEILVNNDVISEFKEYEKNPV